jgi:predicted XRE-type DNA-binding protein
MRLRGIANRRGDRGGVQMGEQLHRRLPQALIEETLEALSQHTLSEVQACEMLGIKRARLYRLERQYLQARLNGGR